MNKETYTKVFPNKPQINDVTMKEYMSTLWQNTRVKEEGGLRLTDYGLEFLKPKLELAIMKYFQKILNLQLTL